jgi:hypothetical protein
VCKKLVEIAGTHEDNSEFEKQLAAVTIMDELHISVGL